MSFRLSAPVAALVLFVAAFAAPVAAFAAPATTVLAADAGHELVFVHPGGWQARVSGGAHGGALSFLPAESGDFRIVVQAMPRASGMPANDAELEASVRRSGESMLHTATQSALELVRVAGEQASGFVYHLTDRKPESGPGDFRELRGGAILVGPYFLAVEVLTHSDDTATVAEALAMLAQVHYQESPARP